ncbi:cytidine deaminase [hydrocarbon metagenome]|uniref:cytidine deaminase n=1 Tax=hydrocarbon metagenome TaxID=938273 RepID=A0A0W8E6W0_9ZZZZ
MDAGCLIEEARKAQLKSYSPYSGYKVGAALLGKTGKIYTGTNIENSSYGLSICAERTALFNAVNNGEVEFSAIAVSSSGSGYVYPCGACLQVLAEFASDLQVIVSNEKDGFEQYLLSDLLPQAFKLSTQEG